MEEFELQKLKGDRKLPTSVLFKRTMHYVKPELPSFIVALVLLLGCVFVDLYLPLMIEDITRSLTNDVIDLNAVLIKVLIYFIIGALKMLLFYFEGMLLQRAGQRIVYNIRMDVYEHILNMSQNQFDEMPVGSLVTRVASYTQSMSDLFTDVLVKVLKNLLLIIGVYAFMLIISWKLALVMLIPVSIVIISSIIFSKATSKIFRHERKCISDLNAYLNENLSGMKITQIFNQEKYKEDEFEEKNDALRKARYKVITAFAIYRPLITLVYIASVGVCVYLGYKFGLDGAAIFAFYLYLSQFFNPIQELSDQLNNLQKAFTASERLFNLMDVAPEVRDIENPVKLDHFEGKIEFRNVWFAYKKDEWILKDVSFVINPKETVAFVGATGAGKTTILGLIVRNYEIQKGQILIDDVDIKTMSLHSLRKKIGQMLQDVFLFSGSIKDNITLYDEKYSDEEVMAACDYVNASSFINKLPNKLNEEVIERGENFSQGQRQLLSFARTVLAKPQILILDEATANIDTETEVVIQESLEKIKNIGTMLVVAHRLSTIQHADQIYVLNKGELTEHGNHQELLAKKGYYYKLYQLQFENKD